MNKTEPITERQTPPARRNRPLYFWAFAVINLVCGIFIGAIGSIGLAHHVLLAPRQNTGRITEHITHHLQRKLDLTDEQARQIEGVLRTRLTLVQEIRSKAWADMAAQLEETKKEISGLLNENQRQKWRKHADKIKGLRPYRSDSQVKE